MCLWQFGIVQKYLSEKERYQVKLSCDSVLLVRGQNLITEVAAVKAAEDSANATHKANLVKVAERAKAEKDAKAAEDLLAAQKLNQTCQQDVGGDAGSGDDCGEAPEVSAAEEAPMKPCEHQQAEVSTSVQVVNEMAASSMSSLVLPILLGAIAVLAGFIIVRSKH